MIKTLFIKSIECTDRTRGTKFTAYKACGKGGRFQNFRFTRSCMDTIRSEGRAIPTGNFWIDCDEDDLSVDTNRLYPVIYCNYFTIHTETETPAEKAERKAKALSELLD